VHIDVVARRLAGAWGLQRVGSRMQDAVETAARIVVRKGSAKRKGDFLWPVAEGFQLKARGPMDGDPSSERKLEYIAPEEIALAMQRVCRDGGGIERDALLTETARVFGVQRTGRVVLEVLEAALAKAVKQGGIIEREGRLIAPQ